MVYKSTRPPLNLSFSGCGFLGIYHIGVICAFKEHAPEVLENTMAGCSAGALAAACTMSGCCLGQMCSDVLEIAVRARSRTLGPLHPTFNIVDIIRNSLRRILPPNAHEICSGRLFISLTRWKDNKNVMINQYHTREELIQVLVCSSFVPYWSGMIPCKFRDEYYWDGGLTNNNPIIDENTITISPFAGESDICPRDESGSFYSLDFRGTDILCTQENLFRVTRALFPPSLSVLKQVCWRGYIDGLKFLQTRNLIKSSHLNTKTSISSVLGDDYTEPTNDDEKQLANGGIDEDVEQMYEKIDDDFEDDDEGYSDSDHESCHDSAAADYSSFCEKVTRKKDLPTPLFAVFADARQKVEEPLGNYFTHSKIYKIWSVMTLPVTLPIDFTYAVTRRVLGVFRPTVPSNETTGNRAMNYLWSFFGDENNEKYCYHVNDCECTGHHQPAAQHPQRRRRSRRRVSRLKRETSIAQSLTASSTQSDIPTDDDDLLTNDLSQPDLVSSIKTTNPNDEYCQQLQQMADLVNQSSIVPIPFFGKDDPLLNVETNQLPTSNLEKNVLFN